MLGSPSIRPRSLPLLRIAERHPALQHLFQDAADHLARDTPVTPHAFDQRFIDQGVYVLTRIPAWTVVCDLQGRRLDLLKELRHAPDAAFERRVRILPKSQVVGRLLAVRLPPAAAAQRRERGRRAAKQRGRPVSQRKLDRCDWNLLGTNAPAPLLGLEEAGAVRRVRWQIDLVFKVFKSEGQIAARRSVRPERVLCELFAKLLGMVVQQWALRAAGYQMRKHSARRAPRRLRQQALALLAGLRCAPRLAWGIRRLAKQWQRHWRIVRLHACDLLFKLLEEAA